MECTACCKLDFVLNQSACYYQRLYREPLRSPVFKYKGQIISLEDDTKTVRDLGIRNNDEILVSSINSVSITIRVSSNVFVS